MKTQSSIQELNTHVVDQIAAGEVVERPAQLIKELIENSLDAKAKSIEIQFSEGGLNTSVKDDGEGIHPQELSLALSRHATSKIKDSKDIFSLQTYGFRGEALASIASVSCLTLISRTKNQSQAFRIKSDFGKTLKVEAINGSQGTSVVVNQLFQNVPARLHFLKSESYEASCINKVITAQALSHPEVTFRVIYKNKLVFFWQACNSYHQRAEMILGKPLYSKKVTENQWTQEVILSAPNKTEKTSKKIKLFVNGRSIEDKTLYGALLAAHRNVLMHGEYPVCVLHFKLPAVEVDVNVHPTKNQVRFRNPSRVFKMTQKTARDLLEQSPWMAELNPLKKESQKKSEESFSQYVFTSPGLSQFKTQKNFKKSVSPKTPSSFSTQTKEESFLPHNISPETSPSFSTQTTEDHKNSSTQRISPETSQRTSPETSQRTSPETSQRTSQETSQRTSPETPQRTSQETPQRTSQESLQESDSVVQNFSSLRVLAQAHKTYIVTQSQNSLVLIDQHAAHERILFEKIMDQFRKGKIEKQKKLIPLTLQLDGAEVSALLSMKKNFKLIGIEIESQKTDEIQVLSSPLGISVEALEKSIRQFADLHVERSEEFNVEKFVSDFSATSACHSAIRAGQVLSYQQMESLLEQMDRSSFSSFCPHGRPVFVEYPLSQIEKDFCRTV